MKNSDELSSFNQDGLKPEQLPLKVIRRPQQLAVAALNLNECVTIHYKFGDPVVVQKAIDTFSHIAATNVVSQENESVINIANDQESSIENITQEENLRRIRETLQSIS
ncbi:MAG: hypothetical protein NVSMB46_04570 [Candidatus Saccharimonadales bacterium]